MRRSRKVLVVSVVIFVVLIAILLAAGLPWYAALAIALIGMLFEGLRRAFPFF